MKNLEFAWQLILNPQAAFQSLKEKPHFWFPLLTITILGAAVWFWFYAVVDFDWLREQMAAAAAQGKDMSEADRAKMASFFSKNTLMWGAVIGGLIVLPLIRLIEAAYYLLIGKMTRVEATFKQWFALACWSGFPAILVIVLMALAIIIRSNGQMSPDMLSMLSLNELFFHVPVGNKWHGLLTSLTLLNPYIWWLTIVGVKTFSQRSTIYSVAAVAVPLSLIYGGWALFASLR